MSRFSFRYKIEKDFEQWCKRNNIKNCAMNFVAFLEKRYDVDIETLPYSQEEIFRRLEIMENAIDEAEKKQPVDESVRNKTMCYEPLTVKKRKLLVIAPKDEQTITVSFDDMIKEHCSWMVRFYPMDDVRSAVDLLKEKIKDIDRGHSKNPVANKALDIINSCFPVFKEENKNVND